MITISFTYNGTANSNWRVLLYCTSNSQAPMLIHPTDAYLGYWAGTSFVSYGFTVPDSTDTDMSISDDGTDWIIVSGSNSTTITRPFSLEDYPVSRVGGTDTYDIPNVIGLYPSDSLAPQTWLPPVDNTYYGSGYTYANGTISDFSIDYDISESETRLGIINAGSSVIYNNGDVESSVIITMTGPLYKPKIRLGDYYIFLDNSYDTGVEVIVDTSECTVTVDGVNSISDIDVESTFFKLSVGENTVLFTENDSPSTSDITLQWKDTYLGV